MPRTRGRAVVEVQRNGKYRVSLDDDEYLRVSDIPTKELAEEFSRVVRGAFTQGIRTYRAEPPWRQRYDD